MKRKHMTLALLRAVNANGGFTLNPLTAMDTAALNVLRGELRDKHDAHRDTHAITNGSTVRFGGRVDPELKAYLRRVESELLTRQTDWYSNSCRNREPVPSRYESRRPVNVLKRTLTSHESQGTMSLGDLQAAYGRVRHG